MNPLSERDKIIMELKSELFDIQQNVKNIKKLEESNKEYKNENEILQNSYNKLEFMLNKTKGQTSKQINDLQLDIKNLNDELSIKKESNIKLFIQNENLEKKIEQITHENYYLSEQIKQLINQDSKNKIIIENYQQQIKIYENRIKSNYLINENEKFKKIVGELKEKYEKNINFFHKKINELQVAINQLYCDNKKLVKIYKLSYNKKEINEKIILSLINTNLLPTNIIIKDIGHYETEPKKYKLRRNKSNNNSIKLNKSNHDDLNYQIRTKTPSKEYLNMNFKDINNNENINRNLNLYDFTKKNKTETINRSHYNSYNDNDIFTPYGYDINKTYNFNKNKLSKNHSNKIIFNNNENSSEYSNIDYINSMNSVKDNNKLFYDLITTQEENITLKKIILNLAKQNEKIIDEIDNIVKISGMCTIDVTTEGIKHLEQIIFNNRELLEKYLEEVKKNKS